MKFELIRAGHPATAPTTSDKNVNVTFDGKTFKMREVLILKQSGGKITVSFKWATMDFVDYFYVKHGKFANITAQLGNKTLKIKNAEFTDNTMSFVIVEGWVG